MELVQKRYYTAHLFLLMLLGAYLVVGGVSGLAGGPWLFLPHSISTVVFGLIGPAIFFARNFATDRIGDWLYNFLAFVFNLPVASYLVINTGHFHSPFIFLWCLVCFEIGITGRYLPILWGAASLLFFVLFQPVSGEIDFSFFGAGFMLMSLASCYLGYLFWNMHYLGYDERVVRQIANIDTRKNQAELLANTVPDGVVTCNQDMQIAIFNPVAAKLTGWSRTDAAGLDLKTVFDWVDDKGVSLTGDDDPFTKAFTTREEVRTVCKLEPKGGEAAFISVVVSPIIGTKDQQVLGMVAILRDVSKERSAEAQRAEFISTASHEMRTPVAAIEGYLALVLNDRVATIDDRARNYLTKAHESTRHLGKLFQDLLTSAKAEDGRLSSHPTAVEMGSYLERLAEDLKFVAEKKGLTTEFVFGSSEVIDASVTGSATQIKPLYYTYVDPDRLREVITNLFDNAVKYTESGKVTLGLTSNDEVVQFYIRDTGPGIPAADVPHLFQKFYRVDNSATRTIGGTGLGLFICRKIVELYKGHIWAESEVGKGTSFFVNLPRISTQRAQQLSIGTDGGALPEIT